MASPPSPSPPSFDAIDFETDPQYLAWRARVETTDADELKLRQKWYKRTYDPNFRPPASAAAASEGVRQRRAAAPAPAPSAAAAPPPPRRPAPSTTTQDQFTARNAARFVVLALLPFALILTPALARLVAALPLPALSRLAPLILDAGTLAYTGCLAASFVSQLLAVRDKHGVPPVSAGVAALRDWAARALNAGVAADAALLAWALLFLIHRHAVRVGLALVPLAVAAAGAEQGGVTLGVSSSFKLTLPPRGVVGWWVAAKPLGPQLATARQIAAWGHVATTLYVTFARFPLALLAGAPGSGRATGLLAYYLWTLLRARKSAADADAAAQRDAWRAAGAWARPRIEAVGGVGGGAGGGLGRTYAFVRDKWWDAPVGFGAGGGGGAAVRGR